LLATTNIKVGLKYVATMVQQSGSLYPNNSD